jgi:hypothetical protein
MKHCLFCNKEYFQNNAKFCSRACNNRHNAKTNAPKLKVLSNESIKPILNDFNNGIPLKQLANQVGCCYKVLKRSMICHGVWIDRPLPQNTKKKLCPNKLIEWEYKRDARILNNLDKAWNKHPAVLCWEAHWKDKAKSCARAMLRYKRYRHLPEFKIVKNLRHRIWFFTFRNNIRKSATTMQLVGCSPEELRAHLEYQFKDGMGWHNYGSLRLNGWEIDHIKPCTAFDLTDEQAQRECFHYSNLQPMWKDENIRKGGRNQIKTRIPSFSIDPI